MLVLRLDYDPLMETILDILAVIVFLMLVISVPRAVRRGNPGPGSGVLAGLIALAVIVFGVVSVSVASGFAASNSSEAHVALLIGYVVVFILCGISWSGGRSLAD